MGRDDQCANSALCQLWMAQGRFVKDKLLATLTLYTRGWTVSEGRNAAVMRLRRSKTEHIFLPHAIGHIGTSIWVIQLSPLHWQYGLPHRRHGSETHFRHDDQACSPTRDVTQKIPVNVSNWGVPCGYVWYQQLSNSSLVLQCFIFYSDLFIGQCMSITVDNDCMDVWWVCIWYGLPSCSCNIMPSRACRSSRIKKQVVANQSTVQVENVSRLPCPWLE